MADSTTGAIRGMIHSTILSILLTGEEAHSITEAPGAMVVDGEWVWVTHGEVLTVLVGDLPGDGIAGIHETRWS